MNNLSGSDKILADRIKNLEIGEKKIAASVMPSQVLQKVLIDRHDLVKGLSDDAAREVVKDIPDHILWEHLCGEYYLYKDIAFKTQGLVSEMQHRHKGVEMRSK